MRRAVFFTVTTILLTLLSCPAPPSGVPPSDTGMLNLELSSLGISEGMLVPEMDVTIADYTITGAGPGGGTFSSTTADQSVSAGPLAPGEWNITATAHNAGGDTLGEGEGSITIKCGAASTVSIDLCTFPGLGAFDFTVLWDSGTIADPSVSGWLIPWRGRFIRLPFTISADGTAACRVESVRSGFYLLFVKLSNNGVLAHGAVFFVWIVPGRVTAGTIDFRSHTPAEGAVTVNVSLETADPLSVEMTGQAEEVPQGLSMTVVASTADTADNVMYVWYVNGESVGAGETIDVGSDLAVGVYRLDVTGFTADGKRAGSATAMFRVTPVP